MRSRVARAVLAVLATGLVIWSAVLWRDERIGSSAVDRILRNPDLGDAAWADEMESLRDAELLNPGTSWDIARAGALLQRGRPDDAERVIEDVVGREPDNVEGWVVLHDVVRGRDPARAAEARAAILRLNPRPEGR
jgi:predicted Zn-dependent protease